MISASAPLGRAAALARWRSCIAVALRTSTRRHRGGRLEADRTRDRASPSRRARRRARRCANPSFPRRTVADVADGIEIFGGRPRGDHDVAASQRGGRQLGHRVGQYRFRLRHAPEPRFARRDLAGDGAHEADTAILRERRARFAGSPGAPTCSGASRERPGTGQVAHSASARVRSSARPAAKRLSASARRRHDQDELALVASSTWSSPGIPSSNMLDVDALAVQARRRWRGPRTLPRSASSPP